MSIAGSNRNPSKMSARAHDFVDASISAALRQPSKAELRAMLAKAAENTAKIATEGGNDALDH